MKKNTVSKYTKIAIAIVSAGLLIYGFINGNVSFEELSNGLNNNAEIIDENIDYSTGELIEVGTGNIIE